MPQRAVLLVNLGSPDSTSIPDVRRYLREFLGDPRVLDINPVLRWLLLEGSILRKRPRDTAHAYASVWTKEGSPLIVTSLSVQRKLQGALGAGTPVYLAMRYGNPSIGSVLARMAADGIDEALLFPQYPHYAMASWETVTAKAEEERSRRAPRMKLPCVQPFYADPDYIEALWAVSAPALAQPHDHLLFSYHGLPARHMRKADPTGCHCLRSPDCCTTPSPAHATCYRAQVFATTRAFVARGGIPAGKYSDSFQSRLAGEPWLEPFTDVEFERLARSGAKRLLVMCPAFVADCLETLEEIALRGKETFLAAGGESFAQIPCLNDQQPYIDFLAGRVRRWLG
ncbi:MAG TPA: ferrochelatase [Opitutaceae bacterium]|nr:ferrochelatase [Opitutaceae bacterium]